jgi:oxidase EvaA
MREPADPIEDFRQWQAQTITENAFACTPIDLDESTGWGWRDGFWRHRTGNWFFLAGVAAEARHPALNGAQQLIIVQRQIAINGFLLRRKPGGAEVLFQGRAEPGNIDGMQLAPTVQSTESNYKRVHGGKPTPFIDYFLEPSAEDIVLDQLQSEEGTRYLAKYNRNIVHRVCDGVPVPHGFRWYDLAAIRRFVLSSNILNTDARSVLSSVNWDALAGEAGAFGHHPAGSIGAELRASYTARPGELAAPVVETLRWLARLRAAAGLRTQILPIRELRNWVVEPDSIREVQVEQGFRARQFRVVALNREVSGWDQPLIDSAGIGRLTLVLQQRGGILRLLSKASYEIGYQEGVQLSASITRAPGAAAGGSDPVEDTLAQVIADGSRVILQHRCRQSEEGGRFYQDENDYEVVVIDAGVELPDSDGYRWLTLAEVRELMRHSGVFSMEFRGVLALLLAYL